MSWKNLDLVFCTGEFLGLTGARLNGKELVAAGLATHFVPSEVISNSTRFYVPLSESLSWNCMCFEYILIVIG